MTRETLVPSIPDIRSDNGQDILRAIKSTLDVREGRIGDPLDQYVTLRDLTDIGLTSLGGSSILTNGGRVPVVIPGGDPDGYNPATDYATPPVPTNLTAHGGFSNVYLSWDGAPYRNHSYTEIWRATTDNLGVAIKVGTSSSNVFADPAAEGTTYYYWIRFVSVANITGPYNSTVGTSATTATDPGPVLDLLTGQITESQLYTSLGQRINLIDAPASVTNSVAWRVAQEAAARATAIAAESTARSNAIQAEASARAQDILSEAASRATGDNALQTQINTIVAAGSSDTATILAALQSEQTARISADQAEATSRETLATQMRGSYTGNDPSQLVTGILFNERQARVSAEGAISSQVSALSATVTNNYNSLNSAITSEQTARATADTALSNSFSTLTATVGTKSRTFYQSTAPTATAVGDLWFDTANNNRAKRWDGSAWVDTTDTRITLNAAAITAEQTARADADTALATSISQLTSTVTGNYNTLNSAITSEQSTRASADTTLTNSLNALTSTVTTNKASTDASIATEASTRATADSALSTSITQLTASFQATQLGLPLSLWVLNNQTLQTVSDGKVGTQTLRLSASGGFPNQGSYVAIDPTKKYRVRFWARPVSSTNGVLYFSLRQFLDNAGNYGPVNGGRSPYKPVSVSRAAHNAIYGTDAWGEYSYVWSSSDWQAGVKFVQPEFLNNYNGTAGYWEIQDFAFTEVTAIEDNSAAIQTEATTRANADSSLSSLITSLTSTVNTNYSTLNSAITSEQSTRASADTALSNSINALSSTVTGNKTSTDAAIVSEANTRASADTALTNSITTLSSTVTGNYNTLNAAIQSEQSTRASADSALSSSITTLQSVVNSNAIALQTEQSTRATADGQLFAQYTVKIDNNGHVSGFGLASTSTNGTPTSAFIVRADRFAIAGPSDTSDPLGTLNPTRLPFIVTTTPTVVNGRTYPAGTWIDTAFIANATIGTAQINDLTADKITAGTLTASISINTGQIYGGVNTSGSAPGSAGFGTGFLLGNYQGTNQFFIGSPTQNLLWNGSNLTVKGVVYASAGSFTGSIYADSGYFRGSVNTGNYTGYAWPSSGGGSHLSSSGLLLGNANSGKYFQVTGDGDLYAPGFSIVNGAATFTSGSIGGNTISASSVRSPNYVANSTGWLLRSDGYAEFGNVKVRGDVQANSLTAGTVYTENIVGAAVTSGYSATTTGTSASVTVTVPAGASTIMVIASLGPGTYVGGGEGSGYYTPTYGNLIVNGVEVVGAQTTSIVWSTGTPAAGTYTITVDRTASPGVLTLGVLVTKR